MYVKQIQKLIVRCKKNIHKKMQIQSKEEKNG